jgi:hypothetical protein
MGFLLSVVTDGRARSHGIAPPVDQVGPSGAASSGAPAQPVGDAQLPEQNAVSEEGAVLSSREVAGPSTSGSDRTDDKQSANLTGPRRQSKADVGSTPVEERTAVAVQYSVGVATKTVESEAVPRKVALSEPGSATPLASLPSVTTHQPSQQLLGRSAAISTPQPGSQHGSASPQAETTPEKAAAARALGPDAAGRAAVSSARPPTGNAAALEPDARSSEEIRPAGTSHPGTQPDREPRSVTQLVLAHDPAIAVETAGPSDPKIRRVQASVDVRVPGKQTDPPAPATALGGGPPSIEAHAVPAATPSAPPRAPPSAPPGADPAVTVVRSLVEAPRAAAREQRAPQTEPRVHIGHVEIVVMPPVTAPRAAAPASPKASSLASRLYLRHL